MSSGATGSESSRLIIIRGNSGSGKSKLAHAIRAARPRGVAIIGHDVLDVVIEGILQSESYGEMLTQSRNDHAGITRCYYYELALEETLERHRTKALAGEVSEADVASWYRSDDRIAALDESVFDARVSTSDALERVLSDAGWAVAR